MGKIRLFSSSMMLSTILLTIACVIFTTYFDGLIQLRSGSGYFITDNSKMRKISESVLKVSLNGLSLTVISFTIVSLLLPPAACLNLNLNKFQQQRLGRL